jgi:hypothetical protein
MVCSANQPIYIPQMRRGIYLAKNRGDGYGVTLSWYQAYVDDSAFRLAYNVYYSSERETVFSDGPKYLSLNLDARTADIGDFVPGENYYFAIRATEYDPTWYNLSLLPSADGYDGYALKIYPETLLLDDIDDNDLAINIADINLFPPYGVIQVGVELIRYVGKNVPTNTLIISERGFLNTDVTLHTVDGYDGYKQRSPIIRFFAGLEDSNNMVVQEEIAINPPNDHYVLSDGYKDKTEDLLTTDLSASDADRVDFPSYDYVGWHRTDPRYLFNGECLDSYIGGEMFCADGYNGIGNQVRNIPIAERSDQREEALLDLTGEPVVLVKRLWKGIVCKCVQANKEYPEHRCPHCFGTGFVTGYEQYYNPRRSDSRILVRFGPAPDDLKMEDAGLESTVIHDCWTLVVPAIKDRDFIIRFNEDGTEEFRYEVLDVTRNKLFFSQSGKQNFKAQRVRKTDPIYQWRAFRNTATMPLKLNTTVGLLRGPNDVPKPHVHQIVLNEGIMTLSQINQTTGVTEGHNHTIINGIVQEALGHTHNIVI